MPKIFIIRGWIRPPGRRKYYKGHTNLGWFFMVSVWRFRAAVIGLCLTTAASAAWPQAKSESPGLPTDRSADTYVIYSMLMPGQVFKDMDSGQAWAISDTTVNEDDVNPRLAPEATLQPPDDNAHAFQEAVNDYNQRKKERFALSRHFQLDRPYVLLTPTQGSELKQARTSPDSSSDIQSEYANYLGITYFSEVYFNIPQTAALVYILDWCGNFCSQSEWVYLEKQNGVWVRRSGKAPPQT
jgi:hypothetical protein